MKKIKYYLIIIILVIVLGIKFLIKENNELKINDYSVYIECVNENSVTSGSGFVYKEKNNKNYIITNYHVIDGYENIFVYNSKKEKIKAVILNKDEYTDLAILVIENKLGLDNANIGDSDKINVGDNIYTMGNPISINELFKLKKGSITNLDKEINIDTAYGNTIFNTIEISAEIKDGNSGGPILNEKKEVIGIVFVKEEETDIAYVIPINYINEVIKKLESNELNRPTLGAIMTNTTNIELIDEYGIKEVSINGVILLEIYESYNYGFQKGDIITKFNNTKISDVNELKEQLYKFQKGDNVEIEYYRNGISYIINIELE